ncbi:hypothetical protein PtA15_5A710 [Puccinia triticina]|uniref:Uncharacterized protein n=1 Tax=Puccinia triticina TaxID=208348 RepID=A0ABY7CLZ1_9BASI|nr:uncharacterized protein PtA15_5A710 [Puccinia triticina]WAQ85136.1 hypothetical protein PtA15_5A710 [Puccinia triticina]
MATRTGGWDSILKVWAPNNYTRTCYNLAAATNLKKSLSLADAFLQPTAWSVQPVGSPIDKHSASANTVGDLGQ